MKLPHVRQARFHEQPILGPYRNYSEGGYRTSERPSDGKRMTIEDGNKSSEQRMTLLAHSRKVGAYATKAGSSLFGSERARNLLLDFCHPQIAFGLVVGLSRQLHRLHLWRREFSRSPIRFIPCMGNSLRSSITVTIGENIVSRFTRPLIMYERSPQLGPA